MRTKSNAQFNEEMRARTFLFALNTLKYLSTHDQRIPKVIQYQLSKSATSVGANFRAFCRGRSAKERFAKICIVVEEADETQYWFEMIKNGGMDNSEDLECLYKESDEILRITASIKHGFEK